MQSALIVLIGIVIRLHVIHYPPKPSVTNMRPKKQKEAQPNHKNKIKLPLICNESFSSNLFS